MLGFRAELVAVAGEMYLGVVVDSSVIYLFVMY